MGKGKGYAFVLFMFPQNALQAMQQLDGSIFQGRILHVIPAKKRPLAQGAYESWFCFTCVTKAYSGSYKRGQLVQD